MASGALVVCLAAPAHGRQAGGKSSKSRTEKQTRSAETPIDEFMGMSPEEQRDALNRLPPAERMKLEERLQRFSQLPSQQQQALRKLYDQLHQLPPDRQKAVRKSLNQFTQQPAARRQAIRQELKSIAPLEAEDRKARMATAEFREKFSEKEQGIIRDMSDLFPAR
jgi:Protein of unknown function (DUF3106)